MNTRSPYPDLEVPEISAPTFARDRAGQRGTAAPLMGPADHGNGSTLMGPVNPATIVSLMGPADPGTATPLMLPSR